MRQTLQILKPEEICGMEAITESLGPTEFSEHAAMSASTEATFAAFAAHESGDTLPFYELEGQVLALWDQLNELKLEQGLLEAEIMYSSGEQPNPDGDMSMGLKEAEIECLEARAGYILRQSVVEDVLIADPVLKAVHSGVNATPTERALHPLVERRDVLGIAHANLSSSLQSLLRKTTETEADSTKTMRENRALTSKLLELTNKIEAQQNKAMADPRLSALVDQARADTEIAGKRWRIMKSVVAAVIAGSGVDWARQDVLRELVLDDENKDD